MDLAVVLFVVALVVAAAAAYVYLSARKARLVRDTERALPIPRVPGVKVRPLADPLAFSRASRPIVPEPPPPPPRPVPTIAAAPAAAPPPAAAAPPLFDLNLEPAAAAPAEIRWWKQFDGRSETLDDTARLRLIGDLGVVAKEWCVPLLAQAYQEERRPGHRQAALIALAACRSRAAASAFRRAMSSTDAAERAIAMDGLADLEPPPQAKVRHTVERH